MIISVSGFGATGASAYIDVLKEFDTIQFLENSIEFQLVQQTDGLLDLKYNIIKSRRRINVNSGINRFKKLLLSNSTIDLKKNTNNRFLSISEAYVNELISISWHGKSIYDPDDLRAKNDKSNLRRINNVIQRVGRIFNKNFVWPRDRMRYFSCLNEKEFDDLTNKYLKEIISNCGFDLEKPIVLEQLFNPSCPLDGHEFFDEALTIVVDRDPRDVYILTNFIIPNLCHHMPHNGNVDDFIKYYRTIHSFANDDKRVLKVYFEDLIYKYEDTIKMLETNLGLKDINKGTKFKPDFSINNTKLFIKYPQYAEDISKIENELSDYLYNYEDPNIRINYVPADIEPFDQQEQAEKKCGKK